MSAEHAPAVRGSYGRMRNLSVDSGRSPLEPPQPGLVATHTLCVLADITYRQLDYWSNRFDAPMAVPADGSGSNRWFRALDAPKYHTVGRLADYGLRPSDLWALPHQRRLRLVGVMRKVFRKATR